MIHSEFGFEFFFLIILPSDATSLTAALQANDKLTALNLSGNSFEDKGNLRA